MVQDIDLVDGSFFEIAATNNEIYVTGLNLHEIKSEILLIYKGDFELNGLILIGPVERRTKKKI